MRFPRRIGEPSYADDTFPPAASILRLKMLEDAIGFAQDFKTTLRTLERLADVFEHMTGDRAKAEGARDLRRATGVEEGVRAQGPGTPRQRIREGASGTGRIETDTTDKRGGLSLVESAPFLPDWW